MPFALPDLPQTEAIIVEMTNAFRSDNRLGAVVTNPALQAAAQSFADYLARSGAFAHTADGRQPADRALAAGYHYCMVAENIALHQSNRGFETLDLAARAVDGWKNSAPHRANLLQPLVTETGIGIAKSTDADPKFLTVQLFGRPDSLKFVFEIENRTGTAVSYRLDEQQHQIDGSTVITHSGCVPRQITLDTGKVTSKFAARDGSAFVISRGPDGALRVDRQELRSAFTVAPPAASTPPTAAPVLTAKAIKPKRGAGPADKVTQ